MQQLKSYSKTSTWLLPLLATALLAGCGDGDRDPILGTGGNIALAPAVTAVSPLNNAFGVPINSTVSADFNEAMAPITGGASFTVTCAAPCVNPVGTVALDATNRTATFTSPTLTALTYYTATVTGAQSLASGVALASPYVWHFTTGAVADTTRPTVTLTVPTTTSPGPTAGAPVNAAISAVFSESMAPASITAANHFTVTCAAPCVTPVGVVTYSVASKTAVFTPSAPLAIGKTYTATITSTATDIAGNGLSGNQLPLPPAASNYVWTFTTVAALPASTISVVALSIKPAANAIAVCPSTTIEATFNVPSGLRMADLTVSPTTFTLTGPAPGLVAVTAESVVLDSATGRTATFTPLNPLTSGETYTATINGGTTGVKDQAIPGNTMASNYVWKFTAGPATGVCLPKVKMGLIASFSIAATTGVTSTVTVPVTVINGDVVLDPASGATCNAVTIDAAGGFGLCGSNASTPIINGTVISPLYPDAGVTSGAVKADLLATYLSITPPSGPPAAGSLGGATNLPAGTTLGDVTGSALVQGDNLFAPGVYQSLTSILITGDVTLDAQGNPDAVFIFQSSSTVGIASGAATPGVHSRIILINGAKASNVWWQAGTSATLGTFSEFVGNILAASNITMETGASSCGRLLAGAFTAGTFVFDSNVVSVPGHPSAPATCK